MEDERDEDISDIFWWMLGFAFLVETLLWQQFMLAIGMLIYGTIHGVVTYLGTGPNFHPGRYRPAAALLVASMLCFGIFWFNNSVWAPAMAVEIADACDEYHADHGTYPAELEELTPEYLVVIPPAKLTVAFRSFDYIAIDRDDPVLLWYAIPPFGTPTYGIGDRRWKYLD